MIECGNQLGNVFLEVFFSQVTIPCSIIQRNMDSSLEKIVLSYDGVEERLHVDSAVFISIEFQESRCTEKVSEFQW